MENESSLDPSLRNKGEEAEQLELFFEDNPDLKDKFAKVKYRISVLGGSKPEKQAEELGHELTKNWFSIATGGYNSGTMKAALEGADKAIKEMREDPQNKEALSLFNPVIQGITAERFAPIEKATKGENIQTEIAEGKYDVYLRLGKLIEDSKISIILSGETGTEVEVMTNLHFDKKMKAMFGIPSKPVIFIGDDYDNLLENKFKNVIRDSNCVYKVKDVNEAIELVQKIFHKDQLSKKRANIDELERNQKEINKKLFTIRE